MANSITSLLLWKAYSFLCIFFRPSVSSSSTFIHILWFHTNFIRTILCLLKAVQPPCRHLKLFISLRLHCCKNFTLDHWSWNVNALWSCIGEPLPHYHIDLLVTLLSSSFVHIRATICLIVYLLVNYVIINLHFTILKP